MQRTTKKLMIAGAALLATLAVQTTVHAQGTPTGAGVPLVLSITGSGKIQNPNSGNQNDNGKTTTTAYLAESAKISTGEIIKLIGTNEGVDFSKAAKLVYNGGTIEVEDGTNVVDASGEVTINLDPNGDGVWSGTDSSNDNTGADAQKFSGTYLVTLQFNDGVGDAFSLSGLATETYTDGVDGNGNPTKATDSISMTLLGDGTIAGNNAAISGTIKGSGSGIPQM